MKRDTILGYPINRVVAFAGPYISIASGSIAAWLLVHVHVFALFHVEGDKLALGVSQLVVFALTSGLTHLAQSKWLDGWQKWEAAVAEVARK